MTTALIGAAAMGHVGMMDLLLDHGADIDLAVPLSALRWRRPLAMVVRECCVGRTRDTIGTRRGGKGTGESALRSGRRRAGRTSSARMYKGVSGNSAAHQLSTRRPSCRLTELRRNRLTSFRLLRLNSRCRLR
ncbi:hypothetical protein [Streptomyces griseoaurantiacus]|uniref:hypothetical protein n=1 Tax=Streptomyces griseoaurantiacus TaxID=68213 RepID=UPI0038686745